MTHSTVPDRDTLRRIIFQLQRPDWQVRSPVNGDSADGKWHACNGTTDLRRQLRCLLDPYMN